jgi:hypothetical protein
MVMRAPNIERTGFPREKHGLLSAKTVSPLLSRATLKRSDDATTSKMANAFDTTVEELTTDVEDYPHPEFEEQ